MVANNEEFDADEILRDLDEIVPEVPAEEDDRELNFGYDDNANYNEFDLDEESDILE